MGESNSDDEKRSTSWETYKILTKIKENVQQKRRVARDVAAQQSIDSQGNQITIEKRLNMTNDQLSELVFDGKELISNIQLANDRREAHRRAHEDQQRAQLNDNLQHESDEATKKLNAINSRWSELADIADPMDLNERLHYQNERIDNLMKQKDAMIVQLQDALSKAGQTYNIDQLKQQGDIQCLIERIDEQIDVMKTVYLEHLELLHKSIDSERRTFKLYHSNEWQYLYDERAEDGEQMIVDLLERSEANYNEIVATRLEHEEINRKMRIELDRDNDLVQQKLQRIKAEIDLNTEQLNYNYYVLQKRAAENILVRNKQKNRLIKMRSCIAILRKSINDAKTKQSNDIERQTHYVLNLYTNIRELERKMYTFSESDDKKFQHIWQLHETCVESKLKKIMMIDRTLHEKHMGLIWQPFKCKPRQQNQLLSIQSAIESARSQCIDDVNATALVKQQIDDVNVQHNSFSDLFHMIAEQIATQQDWMLGDGFTEILELINDEDQKRIITIDNIFSALGIDSMENVRLLKEYFLPYTSCSFCSKKFTDINESMNEECSQHHHVFNNFFVEQHMIPIIMQQFLIDLDIKSAPKISSKHLDYTSEERLIDTKDVEQFWMEYLTTIPSDLELIWDTIDSGLNRYLQILKRRQKLSNECTFLRQQNAEISHLLQQYEKKRIAQVLNKI